jgi:hypothetical protein
MDSTEKCERTQRKRKQEKNGEDGSPSVAEIRSTWIWKHTRGSYYDKYTPMLTSATEDLEYCNKMVTGM